MDSSDKKDEKQFSEQIARKEKRKLKEIELQKTLNWPAAWQDHNTDNK